MPHTDREQPITHTITTPTTTQLVTDVLGEEMEETYNEAAAFWQELKRELARAQAEKVAFLSTPGILEEDLDLSSEEEEDDPLGELDGMIDDSDSESVAARRRCVRCV